MTKLWIGGTSGLANTYFNAFPDSRHEWFVVGLDEKPTWLAGTAGYQSCDLTLIDSVQEAHKIWSIISNQFASFDQIVVSIRPPLMSPRSRTQAHKYNESLLQGLRRLLQVIIMAKEDCPPKLLLHISSIAAVDHHLPQVQVSIEDKRPEPHSSTLAQPYDRFKRACEELVVELAEQANNSRTTGQRMQYTNLRLGGLFSDTPQCIMCNSFALQIVLIGGANYIQHPIDCNSSRNVGQLMHCILTKEEKTNNGNGRALRPAYYYTRPLRYPKPLLYGDYMDVYQDVYQLTWHFPIPAFVSLWFISLLHLVATLFGSWVPYLHSADYLMQVSLDEHSFSADAVRADFPELMDLEEDIVTCFRRRKSQQEQQDRHEKKFE